MQTEQAVIQVLNPSTGVQESNERVSVNVPFGFPKPSLEQLEELLEERQNPDRRVMPCERDESKERRKSDRRRSGR